jgi:hypothetical protein
MPLLIASLALQWWLFAGHVRRHVAAVYPTHHDQLLSLAVGYGAYETTRAAGASAAFAEVRDSAHPMGLLLPIAGWLSFHVRGPSRLSALAVNFAAYALLQATVVVVLRRLAGWPAALIGWGLTWALRTVHQLAGGIVDFRGDFAAVCLYAVWLGIALAGRALESRRAAFWAGLAAAACVWARFLTIVYVAAILGAFALVMILRSRRAPSEAERQAAWARCRGAAWCGVVMAALSAPALWWQRAPIAHHYLRGILGPMRVVRAELVGADRPLANLAFYPRSLVDHAGPIVCALAGALALVLAITLARRRERWTPSAIAGTWLLALALVVPLAVLTLLTSKQTLVAGIATGPLLWAIPLGLARGARELEARAPTIGRAAAWTAAALVALAGGRALVRAWARPLPLDPAEVAGTFDLYDTVTAHARAGSALRLSVDHVSDGLNALALAVSAYERTGARLDARYGLGAGIGAVEPAAALAVARESDFVVLTVSEARAVYPADRSLAAARPALRAYCTESMRPLGVFRTPGRQVELFGRGPDR